jgi:hypothetical protein
MEDVKHEVHIVKQEELEELRQVTLAQEIVLQGNHECSELME